MFTLNEDCVNNIISFLIPSSIYSLSRSCKNFIKPPKKSETKQDIIKHDNISLLDYFVNIGKLSVQDFLYAIGSGSINIVKYLVKSNKTVDNYITYAKSNGLTIYAVSAAKSNSLPMIQYIVDIGLKLSENALIMAVENKNIKMINFLISKQCPCSPNIYVAVVKSLNFDIFKLIHVYYLTNNDILSDFNNISNSACKYGNLPVLKYIEKCGYTFDNVLLTYLAIESGDVETFKFIISQQHIHTPSLLEHAIYQEKFNIAEYLLENYNTCSIPNNYATEIMRRSKNPHNIIQWLKKYDL